MTVVYNPMLSQLELDLRKCKNLYSDYNNSVQNIQRVIDNIDKLVQELASSFTIDDNNISLYGEFSNLRSEYVSYRNDINNCILPAINNKIISLNSQIRDLKNNGGVV